jgi:hypothetical protein
VKKMISQRSTGISSWLLPAAEFTGGCAQARRFAAGAHLRMLRRQCHSRVGDGLQGCRW